MANINDEPTCIPVVVAWNDLEPKCRDFNFERALKAEVRDACWMLAQQWRWGEFFGEDGGSIVFSKLSVKKTKINRYAYGLDNLEYRAFQEEIPMETTIEQEEIQPNLSMRLEMGKHWIKLLTIAFQGEGLDLSTYSIRQDFITTYPFSLPQAPLGPPQTDAEKAELIEFATLSGDDQHWHALKAVAGRAIDGWQLWQAMQDGTFASDGIFAIYNSGDPELIARDAAVEQFESWWQRNYQQPTATQKAWNANRLEYQFSCSAPTADQVTQQTELVADEHHGGKLDWYAFDFPNEDQNRTTADASGENFNEDVTSHDVLTLIPSKITFPGMPNPRHWEMEDREVDFGHLFLNSTDVAKLLLQEFMLTYANNWYLIPYQAEVGTLMDVEGIAVKDVFGIRTLVENASASNQASWKRWSLYTLDMRGHTDEVDTRFFLPPTLPQILESKPVEQINFIRDETANMVWGVEKTIADALANGQDGYEAGLSLQRFLRDFLGVEDIEELDNEAKIKYQLATTVPENWIPFIPVQLPGAGNRSVRLQRASMPRGVQTLETPVIRPRTNLLREGLNGTSTSPYYIEEEEVPKSGTIITQRWQRARWMDGRLYTWLSRSRQTGRGGGYSGLQFDQLRYKQPKEEV